MYKRQGLGGACFPTQVKLCPPPSFKAECVIINAVECEPYLTADHQLMLEHAEEIMVGVSCLLYTSLFNSLNKASKAPFCSSVRVSFGFPFASSPPS